MLTALLNGNSPKRKIIYDFWNFVIDYIYAYLTIVRSSGRGDTL
jgi:hypothetical protein